MAVLTAAPAPATGFDPTDDDVRRNPYPYYHWLLRHDPVHRGAKGVWYVSRFADVRAVLHDARFGRAGIRDSWQELIGPGLLSTVVGDIILFQDEPDHGRLRAVVGAAFTPGALRGLQPRIAHLVDELLTGPAEFGGMDVVAELSYPLALTVVLEVLGLPTSDLEQIGVWSRAIGRTLDRGAEPDEIAAGHRAISEFAQYVDELIRLRGGVTRADLLDTMLAAHRRGRISMNEIVSTIVTFIFTGHETVSNQIGNGLLALLRHPGQLRLLREQPWRIDAAVEECLRFDPSIQSNSRQLGADVEFHGRRLREGEYVVVLTAAANRDPAHVAEPDRFDITRTPVQAMSFGAGLRYCLGSYLARLELRAALGALVRLSGLCLAVPEEHLWHQPRTMFRGLAALPIAFRPGAPDARYHPRRKGRVSA